MTMIRSALLAGLGLGLASLTVVQPASAQYYGGGYERRSDDDGYGRRRYERDDRRDFERRDSYRRDYGRRGGFGDDRRRREGYGYRQPNPMAGMSIEDQKRAIKNERKAQKKPFKQGIFPR